MPKSEYHYDWDSRNGHTKYYNRNKFKQETILIIEDINSDILSSRYESYSYINFWDEQSDWFLREIGDID
jgi:hypothetical protein